MSNPKNWDDQKFDAIVRKTLRLSESQYHRELKMGDVASWDSVGHLSLIFAIESGLHCKIPLESIPKLKSIPLILEFLKRP